MRGCHRISGDAIDPLNRGENRLEIPRQCPWSALPAPDFGWPPPRFAYSTNIPKDERKQQAWICNLARPFSLTSFFSSYCSHMSYGFNLSLSLSLSLFCSIPDFLPERLLPKDVFPKFALYQRTGEETPHPASSIARPTCKLAASTDGILMSWKHDLHKTRKFKK